MVNNKQATSIYNNIHYNTELRELTVNMWLQGKSQDQIETAIKNHLFHRSRQRRGNFRGRERRAS